MKSFIDFYITSSAKHFYTGFAYVLLLATASTCFAATETTYVDSVKKWGAWDLDLQPAAGGLKASTTQPLNARESKLRVRTNSFSALAPRAHGTNLGNTPTTPPPTVTLPPVIPPTPPVIPSPIGGPTDGLF